MNITNHAKIRAKQRLGWKISTLKSMYKKVWEEGISHSATKGHLKKYISGRVRDYPGTIPKIYGEFLFLFDYKKTLITLYQIPSNLKKYIKL